MHYGYRQGPIVPMSKRGCFDNHLRALENRPCLYKLNSLKNWFFYTVNQIETSVVRDFLDFVHMVFSQYTRTVEYPGSLCRLRRLLWRVHTVYLVPGRRYTHTTHDLMHLQIFFFFFFVFWMGSISHRFPRDAGAVFLPPRPPSSSPPPSSTNSPS